MFLIWKNLHFPPKWKTTHTKLPTNNNKLIELPCLHTHKGAENPVAQSETLVRTLHPPRKAFWDCARLLIGCLGEESKVWKGRIKVVRGGTK